MSKAVVTIDVISDDEVTVSIDDMLGIKQSPLHYATDRKAHLIALIMVCRCKYLLPLNQQELLKELSLWITK